MVTDQDVRLLDPDVLDDHRHFFDWSGSERKEVVESWFDSRIREVYAQERNLLAASRELGVTKGALIGRARRLGLCRSDREKRRDNRGRWL